MQHHKKTTAIGTLLLSISGMSFADNVTVYRWVDNNNVVHFSQNQPSHDNYTELTLSNLEKKPTDSTPEVNKSDVQQTEQETVDLSQKCQEAQTNVRTLKAFDNIKSTDANGSTRVLSEEEKSQQLAINEKYVEVYCQQ